MYAIERKAVYAYGPQLNKFSFRGGHGASLIGHFELSEYDEQLYWFWTPLSRRDSSARLDAWLYRNMPQVKEND